MTEPRTANGSGCRLACTRSKGSQMRRITVASEPKGVAGSGVEKRREVRPQGFPGLAIADEIVGVGLATPAEHAARTKARSDWRNWSNTAKCARHSTWLQQKLSPWALQQASVACGWEGSDSRPTLPSALKHQTTSVAPVIPSRSITRHQEMNLGRRFRMLSFEVDWRLGAPPRTYLY